LKNEELVRIPPVTTLKKEERVQKSLVSTLSWRGFCHLSREKCQFRIPIERLDRGMKFPGDTMTKSGDRPFRRALMPDQFNHLNGLRRIFAPSFLSPSHSHEAISTSHPPCWRRVDNLLISEGVQMVSIVFIQTNFAEKRNIIFYSK
jgi:hypothetical protein